MADVNLLTNSDSVNPEIPIHLKEYAPKHLPVIKQVENFDEYKNIFKSFYQTLEVAELDNHRFVRTRFLQMTALELDTLKRSSPGLSRLQATPLWLLKVISVIRLGPPVARGRAAAHAAERDLALLMDNNGINEILRTGNVANVNDPEPEPNQDQLNDLTLKVFIEWLAAAVGSLTHLHEKARLGVELHVMKNHAFDKLEELKSHVTNMLVNLSSRDEANSAGFDVALARKKAMELATKYVQLKNDKFKNDARVIFLNFNEVNEFAFGGINGLDSWVQHLSLYANYCTVDPFNVHNVEEFKSLNEKLEPLLKEVRSFQPSQLELNNQKASNLKPSALKLKSDAEAFSSAENKTLGNAKSLLRQIDSMRSCLDQLQISGIPINNETTGIDKTTLEDYYIECTNFISSLENDLKMKEFKQRLEHQEMTRSASSAPYMKIKPLHGFSSWLGFIKSHDSVIDYYKNEIVKAAVVRESLRLKEDKLQCEDLNYDQIMDFLKKKYEDESLIGNLIDKVLTLPRATNERTSYENLVYFFSVIGKLKQHNAMTKLDRSSREKMLPILLMPDNLKNYYMEEELNQSEWKTKQDNPFDEVLSIASESLTEEEDEKHRNWFIKKMNLYLLVVRKIVNKVPENIASKNSNSGTNSKNKKLYSRNYGTANHLSNDDGCPLCHETHKLHNGNVALSLSKCHRFKNMTPRMRNSTVDKLDYCKRCLQQKDPETHSDNHCQVGEDRGLACKNHSPPSISHHVMLCLIESSNDTRPSNSSNNRGGRNGGGGGGRGRGSGFKGRGNNKTNFDKTNKATANITEIDNQDTKESEAPMNVQFSNDPCPSTSARSYKTISSVNIAVKDEEANINKLDVVYDINKTRANLSPVSFVTVLDNRVNKYFNPYSCLCFHDQGSSLGFVLSKTAEKLKLVSNDKWFGTLNTLTSSKKGSFDVFDLSLIDINNTIHNLKLLGVDYLGVKRKIPDTIFQNMCDKFNVSSPVVLNTSGNIEILLSSDQVWLLAERLKNFRTDKFPDACIISTVLSPALYFFGAIGPSVSRFPRPQTTTLMTSAEIHQIRPRNRLLADNVLKRSLNKMQCLKTFIDDYSSNVINCYANYMTKQSVATVDIQNLETMPILICNTCRNITKSCKLCSYVNSTISITELNELQQIKNNMFIVEKGLKKEIHCKYVLKVDPFVAFSAKLSNFEAAKCSALRLRKKLEKSDLLEAFHNEILKTMNDGHIEKISYKNSDEPSHFIILNYVMKDSISQPLRIISNSNFPNKGGHSLNSCVIKGPAKLGSGLKCMLKFRMDIIGWTCDLSRFYRSIITDETTNNLRKFVWFNSPDDISSLQSFRYTRANFGDTPSSLLSELAVSEFIAPVSMTHELKSACSESRLVDDFLSSTKSLESLLALKEDLYKTFELFSFKIKHFRYTRDDNPENEISTLGSIWDVQKDVLKINCIFFPMRKKRGKHTGPPLTPEIIDILILDKDTLARLSGECFSYDGVLLGPINASLRIAYSQSCQFLEDWFSPLHLFNKKLNDEIKIMLKNICNLNKDIKPMPRCIINKNAKKWRIVVSSDASVVALAYTIHLVSDDMMSYNTGSSHLLLSRSHCHKITVPAAELQAMSKAIQGLLEIFTLLPELKEINELSIVLISDSMCSLSSLKPGKAIKELHSRNCIFSIYRNLTEIASFTKNVSIKIAHQKSENIPSDYLTRLSPNPVFLANSDLYRHGRKCWLDKKWPGAEITFLSVDKKCKPSFHEAIAEQHENLACVKCASFYTIPPIPAVARCFSTQHFSEFNCEIPLLSKDIYDQLLSNLSSLIKTLKSLFCILKWHKKFRNIDRNLQLLFAFYCLIKTHQSLFPSKNNKLNFPFRDADGILRSTTRLDTSGAEILNMQRAPPIVSSHDHKLVYKLIRHAHLQVSGFTPKFHLGTTLTTGQLISGIFGVIMNNSTALVAKYIEKCVVCRFIRHKPKQAELGNPRYVKFLSDNNLIFRFCSIDALGPYLKVAFPSSRKITKYYILIITCLISGACNFVIMENVSRVSVHCALYTHSVTYAKPKVIYCDAGRSINPDPSSDSYLRFFPNHEMEIVQLASGHQHLNYCERYVKIYASLLKSALLQRDKLSMPHLTFCEINAVLAATKDIINSRPIFRSINGDVVITPNTFLKPFIISDGKSNIGSNPTLETIIEVQQNLDILAKSVGLAHSHFTNLLKQLFKVNKNVFRQSNQRYDFLPNDYVLIIRGSYYSTGIIKETHGQYSTVLTAEYKSPKTVKIHHQKLVLLFRDITHSKAEMLDLRLQRNSARVNRMSFIHFIF